MKTLCVALVVVLVAVLFPASTYAQAVFAVGPRIGLNFASCSLDPAITGATKSGRTGMIFGATSEVGFANMYYVVFEPQYVQKGFSISGQGGEQTYAFNYLDLPVYFKVKFLHGKVRPYAFLGPDLGIMLSSTVTTKPTGQASTDSDFGTYIGSDFSLDFGGGAEFAIAHKISLLGDVRYMLGLKGIYTNANQPNQSIKTGGFVIMFGALFEL